MPNSQHVLTQNYKSNQIRIIAGTQCDGWNNIISKKIMIAVLHNLCIYICHWIYHPTTPPSIKGNTLFCVSSVVWWHLGLVFYWTSRTSDYQIIQVWHWPENLPMFHALGTQPKDWDIRLLYVSLELCLLFGIIDCNDLIARVTENVCLLLFLFY